MAARNKKKTSPPKKRGKSPPKKRGKPPPRKKGSKPARKSRKTGNKTTSTRAKARKPPVKTNSKMTIRRNSSAPQVVIRRNAAPRRAEPDAEVETDGRTPLTERFEEMGGSHAAAAVGAGAVGNVLGVIAVGQGWIGPKLTAGLMMGSGAATTAAGWYWDADHLMAAGAGLTTAGAFSLTNQYAVDAYEAMEKKAEEKREKAAAERAQTEKARRLAEARALLATEAKKTRNGRRIVVMDDDGEVIEYPDAT